MRGVVTADPPDRGGRAESRVDGRVDARWAGAVRVIPVAPPLKYWTAQKVSGGEAEMFWISRLPPLDPGTHVIEFMVSADKTLTDGLDENGDGQRDPSGRRGGQARAGLGTALGRRGSAFRGRVPVLP